MEKNLLEKFEVSDFYLTAYLLCTGMDLLGTKKENSKKTIFILRDIPSRQELISKYFEGTAKIDPLKYKGKIIDLKSLLYNSEGLCQR